MFHWLSCPLTGLPDLIQITSHRVESTVPSTSKNPSKVLSLQPPQPAANTQFLPKPPDLQFYSPYPVSKCSDPQPSVARCTLVARTGSVPRGIQWDVRCWKVFWNGWIYLLSVSLRLHTYFREKAWENIRSYVFISFIRSSPPVNFDVTFTNAALSSRSSRAVNENTSVLYSFRVTKSPCFVVTTLEATIRHFRFITPQLLLLYSLLINTPAAGVPLKHLTNIPAHFTRVRER